MVSLKRVKQPARDTVSYGLESRGVEAGFIPRLGEDRKLSGGEEIRIAPTTGHLETGREREVS